MIRTLLSLATLLAACARPAAVPPPVPPPEELTQLEAPVRRQFERRHAALESALEESAVLASRLAAAFGAVGQIHFAYGYLESAEDAFGRAAALAPAEPRWHYYLARALELRGRGEEAAAALRRVLDALPDHVPSRLILAELAADRGDSAAAEAGFEAVLRLDSANVRAWAGRSRLALARGDSRAALDYLGEALARQPVAAPLHYQAAMVYRSLGDHARAERHLDRLPAQNVAQVQLAMNDPWMVEIDRLRIGARYHDQRARRALATGRYELAIVELRQALAANPERVFARYGLGAALFQLGREDEALAELRRLLEVAPTHVPTWVLTARILIDVGRPGEAAAALERALELDPADAEALRQQARLASRPNGGAVER